ncbi:hypothetical protein BJQ90_01818 [Arthrobacter sp. SO3]|nr:hypothetical protein [Arthrobacter sp. SO3]
MAFLVRVFEQGQRCLVAAGAQVGDHDPGPGVPDALADAGKEGVGGLGQDHGVRGGHRQRDTDRGVGGVFGVEVGGAGERGEDLGLESVFGQPRGGLLAVDAHDLPDPGGGGDRGRKGAGEDELVPADAFFLHRDAGGALEFQDGAHHDHGEAVPDHHRIRPGQIQDGMNPQGVKPLGQPGGDTPDLDHGQAAHQRLPVSGGARSPSGRPRRRPGCSWPICWPVSQASLWVRSRRRQARRRCAARLPSWSGLAPRVRPGCL